MGNEDPAGIEAVLGLLITVSIASERLVEIVKGVVPWLNVKHADDVVEGWRRAILQVLAVVAGIITALLAKPVLADSISIWGDGVLPILTIGLLASGGSGLWNAVLSYVLQAKELKKEIVAQTAQTAPASSPFALPDIDLGAEQVTSNECYDVEEN